MLVSLFIGLANQRTANIKRRVVNLCDINSIANQLSTQLFGKFTHPFPCPFLLRI